MSTAEDPRGTVASSPHDTGECKDPHSYTWPSEGVSGGTARPWCWGLSKGVQAHRGEAVSLAENCRGRGWGAVPGCRCLLSATPTSMA